MKRDTFSVKQEGDTVRILSRIKGVYEIYHVPNTKEEVARAKERHQRKKEIRPLNLTSNYIPPKKKKPTKEIDLADYFYSNLDSNDFFRIKDFWISLYDSEGDHCFIFDVADEKYKEEIQIGKFFLVKNSFDAGRFDENPNVLYWKVKRLKGGKKILLILPNIVFRDNRFAFDCPKYMQSISYPEVKSLWRNVCDYGYNETAVFISEISKTRRSRRKVRNINREKALLVRKAKEMMSRVLDIDAETISSDIPYLLKVNPRPSMKEYRMQNKMKSINFCLDRFRKF